MLQLHIIDRFLSKNVAAPRRERDANREKNTDIFAAAGRGDVEAVTHLLALQPMLLESKDRLGATPLHLAAANGQEQVVVCLVAQGADLNVADSVGATPLHLAVLEGSRSLTERLIAAGAHVNARTQQGVTPLMLAQAYGRQHIAEYIQACGGAR